jgi:hypothetical protein
MAPLYCSADALRVLYDTKVTKIAKSEHGAGFVLTDRYV